ncbi:MAG TPA: hypothetical protein VIP11_13065 [Gemmatimonadaceae bacterium]
MQTDLRDPLRTSRRATVAFLAAVLAWATACRGADSSGTAMPPLKATYMVDTSTQDRKEIFKLRRDYLAARPHTYQPKPQWSAAEQMQWPLFDLAMPMVYASDDQYRRTHATVFDISPARLSDSSEYVIRTLFSRHETATDEERAALVRVYATRENGRWVLKAFDAPAMKPITYYLARSPEEAYAIGGLDLYIPGSRARTAVADYLVFSGVPRIGEFYAHELVHLTLGWILPDLGAPPLMDEALALWLGGGREMTWPQVLDELATELRRNPSWTAERLTEVRPETFLYRNTAAAALLALAHARGGIPMLKASLRSPTTRCGYDYVGGVAAAMHVTRGEVEDAFRKLVLDTDRPPITDAATASTPRSR